MIAKENPEWIQIEDREMLGELTGLLGELEAVLDGERTAVGELDTASIEEATECKRQLIDRLRILVTQHNETLNDDSVVVRTDDVAHQRMRDELGAKMRRIRAKSHANSLLLTDAMDAVSAAMGIDRSQATYDRRARRRMFTSSNMIRSV